MSTQTVEQIQAMPAGHELNGMVAQYVMGWTPPTGEHEGPWNPLWKSDRINGPGNTLAYYHNAKTGVLLTPKEHRRMTLWNGPIGQRELNPPLYSVEIHRAWEVVIRMESEHGCQLYLEQFYRDDEHEGTYWIASFIWSGWAIGEGRSDGIRSSTMSEAVCRAALEWIEVSTSKVSVEVSVEVSDVSGEKVK